MKKAVLLLLFMTPMLCVPLTYSACISSPENFKTGPYTYAQLCAARKGVESHLNSNEEMFVNWGCYISKSRNCVCLDLWKNEKNVDAVECLVDETQKKYGDRVHINLFDHEVIVLD